MNNGNEYSRLKKEKRAWCEKNHGKTKIQIDNRRKAVSNFGRNHEQIQGQSFCLQFYFQSMWTPMPQFTVINMI